MSISSKSDYDVIIAGAGPAGTSAAIYLAKNHLRVLLLEQKHFPRPKLCGEFISPECFSHFEKLGVADQMLSCKPAQISRTVFYSRGGRRISVPSSWFGGGVALGLSRSAMDHNLFQKAQSLGVDILERATVTDVLEEGERVSGVHVKTADAELDFTAPLTIDATGRARNLTRRVYEHEKKRTHIKPGLVAFKAHFTDAEPAENVCEIYSYRGGYGGLSGIEDGLSNLCFIVAAKDVRRCHSNPDEVMEQTVLTNRRAAQALRNARHGSEWLSVSLDRFGPADPAPKPGLFAVGDSASFIDPFTGSGMLMALESGGLVANVVVAHLKDLSSNDLQRSYRESYHRTFGSRLRISGLLRRTAFKPELAELTIFACSLNSWLRNRLARATRSPIGSEPSGASIS